MRMTAIILALLYLAGCAFAGGRGGHNTTFDPNSNGGNWACIRSAASGTCGGATAHYVNAACDGVTDDSAVYVTFLTTYAVLQSNVNLLFPAGSDCKLPIDGACWSIASVRSSCGTGSNSAVPRMTIWGYGARTTAAYFGGFGIVDDNTHSSSIVSANIGDTSVTLITGAEISRFAIGDWVMLGGLGLQKGGAPPNLQVYEYKLITAINGPIITLNTPLENKYLSTWPFVDNNPPQGPATIYDLPPTWNQNLTVNGLTTYGGFENVFSGRNIALVDFHAGPGSNPAPTIVASFSAAFSWLDSPEIDKLVAAANLYRDSAGTITIQSPTNQTLTSTVANLNGTGRNTTIIGGSYNSVNVGPTGYGGSSYSVVADGATIATSRASGNRSSISSYTFSSGTLTIPNASADTAWAFFVPGQEYFFGDSSGFHCIPGPDNPFHVLAVRQDATNTYIDLDIGSIPSTNCSGSPAPNFVAYGAVTITQRLSGPADLTQFAAPP